MYQKRYTSHILHKNPKHTTKGTRENTQSIDKCISVSSHNERRKQWQKMRASTNTDTHHHRASDRDMSGCSLGVILSTFLQSGSHRQTFDCLVISWKSGRFEPQEEPERERKTRATKREICICDFTASDRMN